MVGRLRPVVAVDVGVQGVQPDFVLAQLFGRNRRLPSDAELRDQGLDAGHALVDQGVKFGFSLDFLRQKAHCN